MTQDTPIRRYKVSGIGVFVKREDLCTCPLCPPLCGCGCGKQVSWNRKNRAWNKYIRYHYAKTNKNRDVFRNYNLGKAGTKQSEESNLKRSRTLKGRIGWNRGLTKETDERIARMAKGKEGKKVNYPKTTNRSKGVRDAARIRMIKLNKSEKRREQEKERMIRLAENHPIRSKEARRKIAENTTKRMLNGQAAYMNSFIRNPSKPQVALFKKIKKIFPNAILNYPSLNKSIDIAIPDSMIAIEYDSSYWHQDKKADEIRQQELELIGWSFLRYVDRIPTTKEIIRDVNNQHAN